MRVRSQVVDVMSRRVVGIAPDASLSRAAALMHAHGVHHLPVLANDGELVGIVTQSDLLAATVSALEPREVAESRDSQLKAHTNVEEIMTPDPVTVRSKAPLKDAVRALTRNGRLRCLPVVDDRRNVVGMVTDWDLLRVLEEFLDDSPYFDPAPSFTEPSL